MQQMRVTVRQSRHLVSYKSKCQAGLVFDVDHEPLVHRQGQEPQSIGLERHHAKCQSVPVANGAELLD